MIGVPVHIPEPLQASLPVELLPSLQGLPAPRLPTVQPVPLGVLV